MSVHKDPDGRWRYRGTIAFPDGTKVRINGSAPKTENTKDAAKQAERDHIHDAQVAKTNGLKVTTKRPLFIVPKADKKEIKFDAFADEFMKTYAKSNNKLSEQKNKELLLACHLRPKLGHLNLDEIRSREIEQLKADLLDGNAVARR